MTLKWDNGKKFNGVTNEYDEMNGGSNFETIYLRWKLPNGFRVMDTADRLGGYSFSSTAHNISFECNDSNANNSAEVTKGYVVCRIEDENTMYLGLEHGSERRKSGFVITGLTNAMADAIRESDIKKVVKSIKKEDIGK